MLTTVATPRERVETTVSRDAFVQAYRWMLLARQLEEKVASLYRAGKITGGVFLGKGQEAVSVAIGASLRKGDLFAPLIRDQAGRIAFGESLLDCLRTYMGVRTGPMRGRDGNVHRGRPREGILPMISHLGAMISVINGALMARRFQGRNGSVGVASLGDGATSTGAAHEGFNQAAVERLPVVFVIANNQYAYSTPNCRQFACEDLAEKGIGYGIRATRIDGTDLVECLEAIGGAVERARSEQRPQMVIASLLRLVGHGEHDDAHYVDPDLRISRLGRDCLHLAGEKLVAQGWATALERQQWEEEASQQVEDALAITVREAAPDPNDEEWFAISSRNLAEGFSH